MGRRSCPLTLLMAPSARPPSTQKASASLVVRSRSALRSSAARRGLWSSCGAAPHELQSPRRAAELLRAERLRTTKEADAFCVEGGRAEGAISKVNGQDRLPIQREQPEGLGIEPHHRPGGRGRELEYFSGLSVHE